MSMYHFQIYENGNIFGKIYTFPKRGTGIAMHSHQPDSYHNTIVLKGTVEIYGPEKSWSQIAYNGQVIDFPSDIHQTHEIAALEDETIIMNTYLRGKDAFDDRDMCRTGLVIPYPPGLKFQEPEKSGWVDIPLTIPLDDNAPVIV